MSELNHRELQLLDELALRIIAAFQKAPVAEIQNAPAELRRAPSREPDDFMRLPEVAKRLDVSKSWLYKHWRDFPFFIKLRGTAVRASRREIEKWTATQKGHVRRGGW